MSAAVSIVSLLATVTDLEERLVAVRRQLAEELAGRPSQMRQSYLSHPSRPSIRLQPPMSQSQSQQPRQRQRQSEQSGQAYRTVALSDVLHNGEVVHIRLHLSREEDATLVCRYDGETLEVCGSEHVPSMVGLKAVKPGELVYRFMDELKAAGLLTRTFTVAPWRVCFVVRDGVEVTVESLRS